MNFKKTLAAVAASAIAVSAMATAAFADTVYGGSWDEKATTIGAAKKVDASSWTELYIADKAALKEVGKDKAIVVYVDGDEAEAFVKIAGNKDGNWNDGTGLKLEAWGDKYNSETCALTIPYSMWGVFSDIQLGAEHAVVYGVAFEDDAETIAAIEALIAADSAAEDTEATEAPADDANTDDTAAAGDTTEEGASKGNSDTGVEGVAAIAGLAIVAAGAVIVAKKRG